MSMEMVGMLLYSLVLEEPVVTTGGFTQSATAAPVLTAGAGGGADNSVGSVNGRGGRVIIHW